MTFMLLLGMMVGLDIVVDRIEGQGHSSKDKVTKIKNVNDKVCRENYR